MDITTQKGLIIDLLSKHNHLRDDDYALIATVWRLEFDNISYENNAYSAYDFLDLIEKGAFTNSESIRRCRAKLQEQYPALRGTKYYERHDHQKYVVEQLNNF